MEESSKECRGDKDSFKPEQYKICGSRLPILTISIKSSSLFVQDP